MEKPIQIEVRINPGASKSEFAGIRDNRLCIRIASPPQDGKANACLCEFLAKTFGCAKKSVSVIKGEKSRLKTIALPASCGAKLKSLADGERLKFT